MMNMKRNTRVVTPGSKRETSMSIGNTPKPAWDSYMTDTIKVMSLTKREILKKKKLFVSKHNILADAPEEELQLPANKKKTQRKTPKRLVTINKSAQKKNNNINNKENHINNVEESSPQQSNINNINSKEGEFTPKVSSASVSDLVNTDHITSLDLLTSESDLFTITSSSAPTTATAISVQKDKEVIEIYNDATSIPITSSNNSVSTSSKSFKTPSNNSKKQSFSKKTNSNNNSSNNRYHTISEIRNNNSNSNVENNIIPSPSPVSPTASDESSEITSMIKALTAELRYYEQLSGKRSVFNTAELELALESSMLPGSKINTKTIMKYLVQLVSQTMSYLLQSAVESQKHSDAHDELKKKVDELSTQIRGNNTSHIGPGPLRSTNISTNVSNNRNVDNSVGIVEDDTLGTLSPVPFNANSSFMFTSPNNDDANESAYQDHQGHDESDDENDRSNNFNNRLRNKALNGVDSSDSNAITGTSTSDWLFSALTTSYTAQSPSSTSNNISMSSRTGGVSGVSVMTGDDGLAHGVLRTPSWRHHDASPPGAPIGKGAEVETDPIVESFDRLSMNVTENDISQDSQDLNMSSSANMTTPLRSAMNTSSTHTTTGPHTPPRQLQVPTVSIIPTRDTSHLTYAPVKAPRTRNRTSYTANSDEDLADRQLKYVSDYHTIKENVPPSPEAAPRHPFSSNYGEASREYSPERYVRSSLGTYINPDAYLK